MVAHGALDSACFTWSCKLGQICVANFFISGSIVPPADALVAFAALTDNEFEGALDCVDTLQMPDMAANAAANKVLDIDTLKTPSGGSVLSCK